MQQSLVRINRGKGGKDRVVPIGRVAAGYVADYIAEARALLVNNRMDGGSLFVSRQTGARLSPGSVNPIVKRIAKAAKVQKCVTPHSFRHACASHMLAQGADIVHIQMLLGHADISTTQVYMRVTPMECKATHKKCHPRDSWGMLRPSVGRRRKQTAKKR